MEMLSTTPPEGYTVAFQTMLDKAKTQILEESATEAELVQTQTEIAAVEHRFASFEKWFRDQVTPELIALRSGLEEETKVREESDEDLVNVLARYGRIMQKHLGADGRPPPPRPNYATSEEPPSPPGGGGVR